MTNSPYYKGMLVTCHQISCEMFNPLKPQHLRIQCHLYNQLPAVALSCQPPLLNHLIIFLCCNYQICTYVESEGLKPINFVDSCTLLAFFFVYIFHHESAAMVTTALFTSLLATNQVQFPYTQVISYQWHHKFT